ncbi:hypothetical protein B0O99DRAFT_690909 [Bisporella sp. PMI_857]|nr:hypothetical protein B0O99DRAFT_690909 [Bisporella sp. PMI_857]
MSAAGTSGPVLDFLALKPRLFMGFVFGVELVLPPLLIRPVPLQHLIFDSVKRPGRHDLAWGNVERKTRLQVQMLRGEVDLSLAGRIPVGCLYVVVIDLAAQLQDG